MTEKTEPEAAKSPEEIVREHVTTLHLIGEQLAQVESWMWQHLADARAAAAVRPPATDRAALREQLTEELLPAWEAMYEPGNVSDYLIGYANDQDAATGMAEAWLRSQAEVTGRLEWLPQNPLDGYDTEFEVIERHDDGIDTGPGIVVRRRLAAGPAAEVQPTATQLADHIADQPMSVVQAAFRILGWPITFDVVDDAAPAVGGAQQPQQTDRTVAYRSALPGAWSIYCTRHTDELGDGATPLTTDDLPDGGLCAECGVDVLIPQEDRRG